MKCSIQRGEAELNGTFLLSLNENICSTARMRKHSLLFWSFCKNLIVSQFKIRSQLEVYTLR